MSLSLPSSLEINIVVSSKVIDHYNRCWNVVWKVQNRKFTNTQIQETASEKSSLSTCELRLLLDCCQESRLPADQWGRRPFQIFLKTSHFSQVFSSRFHYYCHYQSWQILQIPQESVQLYSTLETLLPKSWLQLTGEQNIPTFSNLVLFPRSARVSDFKFILILTNVIVCCRSCFNGINGAAWQEGRTTCTPQTKQPKNQWQWEKSTKKGDLIISGAKNMLDQHCWLYLNYFLTLKKYFELCIESKPRFSYFPWTRTELQNNESCVSLQFMIC